MSQLNNDKRKLIIGKGYSYKDLASQPIIIPPSSNDQIKRLMVLIVSLSAQNDNPNILKEVSCLLDQLYKDQIINKKLYKHIFYKSKNQLDKNVIDSIHIND